MTFSESPLVLVGPMGVGKTTVGKKLAKSLNRNFIDTDSQVVAKHGEINAIFANQGEAAFRGFETEALKDALLQSAVIATGGGVVLSETNRKLLQNYFVVYLSTDGRHQASRLQGGKRPLLKNGLDDWQRIYDERKPLYCEVAKVTIDTSKLSLREIVTQIEGLLA